ncbi:MAG TPA: Trp family transcriptional regulator [Patescibacteria group bacterium]
MKANSILTNIFLSAKSKAEMENLIEGIFTPSEKEELVQRLEIIKMLKKGIAQRTISEKLGVGIATITRGAKEIKEGKFKYVK